MKFLPVYITFLFLVSVFSENKLLRKKKKSNFKADLSFYTTTEKIDKEMADLVEDCGGLLVEKTAASVLPNVITGDLIEKYKLLKYYDITGKTKVNKNKKNAFIIAGEHSRELISVEMILHFMKNLCKNRDTTAKQLLDDYNLRVIVNGNPNGRQKVEKGDYCFRSNLNKVDTNRNWDYSWGKEITMKEEFPGAKAFSEVETQFTLEILKNFNAHIFLTVHSGVFALFHPYAFDIKEPEKNAENMKSVLTNLQSKFCSKCMVGSASKLIGYRSSGTSLDYAYSKLKIPYSFAWEIFTDEINFPEMEKALGIKTKTSTSSPPRFMQKTEESTDYSRYIRSLSKNEQHVYSEDENEDCYNLFNPKTKPHYDFVVNTWVNV